MESHEAVENAYRQHALGKGYVLWCDESRHRRAQKVQQKERYDRKVVVVFGCDRWGKYDASKALKVNAGSARIEAPKFKGNELKEVQLPIPHCCYSIEGGSSNVKMEGLCK